MYSPSPRHLLTYRRLLNSSISQHARIAFTFAFALFSIAFGISSAAAQNRARRARQEPQESARRDNDQKRADDKKRTLLSVRDRKRADEKKRNEDNKRVSLAGNRRSATTDRRLMTSERRPSTTETRRTPVTETTSRDNSKQVVQNPLVRRTALTYTPPKSPDQPTSRPVLVNDITVVSRVGEKSSSSILTTVAPRTGNAAANVPSIWPVMGTLRSGVGMRGNPFGGPGTEYHKGQDIAAPTGTPVMATANGTIIIAGWQRGYGWVVYIDHGNGITTRYGHLSRIDVELGQTIRRGEQLGLVGSTGRSTGPHLHYEVRINGQPVSPLLYLPSQPVLSSVRPQSGSAPAPGAQR